MGTSQCRSRLREEQRIARPGFTSLGGSHWEEDGVGNRDFEIGEIDTNRKHLDALAQQLSERVDARIDELAETLGRDDLQALEPLQALRAQLLEALPDELWEGGVKDLTEFARAGHAEMNAILDAALRGVAVAGATLHST